LHDNNKIESTVNTQPLSFSTPPSTVNNHSGYTGIDIILKQALIKVPGRESAYSPDVLVINQKNLSSEPLWKKSSTVTQAASVPLVIEVVSTNWQNDYSHKLVDYEISGIPEYWIINYSNPKSFVNFLLPSERVRGELAWGKKFTTPARIDLFRFGLWNGQQVLNLDVLGYGCDRVGD